MVLVIPLAMFLPLAFNLGVAGVFLSEPISELIGGTACYVTMQLTVGRQLKQLEQQQAAAPFTDEAGVPDM